MVQFQPRATDARRSPTQKASEFAVGLLGANQWGMLSLERTQLHKPVKCAASDLKEVGPYVHSDRGKI